MVARAVRISVRISLAHHAVHVLDHLSSFGVDFRVNLSDHATGNLADRLHLLIKAKLQRLPVTGPRQCRHDIGLGGERDAGARERVRQKRVPLCIGRVRLQCILCLFGGSQDRLPERSGHRKKLVGRPRVHYIVEALEKV